MIAESATAYPQVESVTLNGTPVLRTVSGRWPVLVFDPAIGDGLVALKPRRAAGDRATLNTKDLSHDAQGPAGCYFRIKVRREVQRKRATWRKRMKRLKELSLILTKPGPTGEFHYVLLLNPNVAMEYLRRNGKVQDGLYARFKDRLIEVGGYGDIEAYDKLCAENAEKAAIEAKVASAATSPPDKAGATPTGAVA